MQGYNAEHHALLYSYMVKALFDAVGEEAGAATAAEATKNYGKGRGRRMAQRCDADGFPRDVMGYTAYKEWRQTEGRPSKGTQDLTAEVPYMTSEGCPWYDAWEGDGHMAYGRYYCRYVDEAIGEGFFGDRPMRLVTEGTRTNGAERCLFTFTGGTYTQEDLDRTAAWKERLGTKALRDWDYHLGHLYAELARQIRCDWPARAEEILAAAGRALDARFGEGFIAAVREYAAQDFSGVGDYEGLR